MAKMFILYDGRAKYGVDTDDCTVMDTAETEQEAMREGRRTWKDHDAIWAEYDTRQTAKETLLENEKLRWDLPPASKGRR